ncbi:leucine-rich repeat protein [Kineothrix sp. MSJ-39]|uniref:leucine-rich repeat protein n=1 Tax=Kineothrix sp. MSJ-39 TaxID=2841533 RepID=UPI001C1132F7|nr:leucine-rich repeat protein [Kineothrix sp. MSJ-39]MBU5428896.1 leucine-rich repeat protein [Kineothrix sp. MSJ-39]
MSKMRNRWLALGLAFLMAFPTNGVVAFAGQENAEVAAVSANDAQMQGEEPAAETEDPSDEADEAKQSAGEELDADEAVIMTSYPVEIGEEKELTLLPKNGTYYLQVTIPEVEEGRQQPVYRVTVDGKTIDSITVWDSLEKIIGWGNNGGFFTRSAGTYWLEIQNDSERVHTVRVAEAEIKSVTADFSEAEIYENGSYYIPGLAVYTLTYADDSVEVMAGNKLNANTSCQYFDEGEGDFSSLKAGAHTVTMYVLGKTITADFTVLSNSVSAVRFAEEQPLEVCYEDGMNNWVYLDSNTKVVVTEDGKEQEYTLEQLNKKFGYVYGVYYTYDSDTGVYSQAAPDKADGYTDSTYELVRYFEIADEKTLAGYLVCAGQYCSFPVKIVANQVVSVSVNTLPVTTVVEEGTDAISFAGLELAVTYKDGSERILSYDAGDFNTDGATGWGLDTSGIYKDEDHQGYSVAALVPGDYTYHLRYAGQAISFPFSVVESSIESISYIGEKIQIPEGYDVNSSLNYTMDFMITMKDQSTVIRSYQRWSWGDTSITYREADGMDMLYADTSEVDNSKQGVYQIYFSLKGKMFPVDVEIIENPVESIAIDIASVRTTYVLGENIYLGSSLGLTATYKDGEIKHLDSVLPDAQTITYTDKNGNEITTGNINELPLGKYTVDVSALGRKDSYTIDIVENPIKSIEVVSGAEQTAYAGITNGYLAQDMTLKVSYKDTTLPSKKVIIPKGYSSEIEDENYPGGKLTINYLGVKITDTMWSSDMQAMPCGTHETSLQLGGFTIPFTITITETPIDSISVSIPQEYRSFVAGEDFYFNSANLPGSTITIRYKTGDPDKVIDLDTYNYYDTVLNTNMNITGSLKDADGNWVSDWVGNLEPGQYYYEVSIGKKTGSCPITITENPVDHFEVTVPDKYTSETEGELEYIPYGNDFKLHVYYTDGTENTFVTNKKGMWQDNKFSRLNKQRLRLTMLQDGEEVDEEQLSQLLYGIYDVQVTAYGKTATYPFTIKKNPIDKIEPIMKEDFSFVAGTETNVRNAISGITVYKTDGSTENLYIDDGYDVDVYIAGEEDNYSDCSDLAAGEYTGYVRYKNKKAEFPVTVVENPVDSITVSVKEENTKYLINSEQNISTEGMTLTVHYKDPSVKDKSFKLGGDTGWYDLDFPGKRVTIRQMITVKMNDSDDDYTMETDSIGTDVKEGAYDVKVYAYGKETTYQIQVQKPEISKITLKTDNLQKTYMAGSGDCVQYTYDDILVSFKNGETKSLQELLYDKNGNETALCNTYQYGLNFNLTDEAGEVYSGSSWFKNMKAGTYTVTFSLYGNEASYQIQLEESGVKSMTVAKTPDYLEYWDGELSDENEVTDYIKGLQLSVLYQDGTSRIFDVDKFQNIRGSEYSLDGEVLYISLVQQEWDEEETDNDWSLQVTYKDQEVQIPLQKKDFSKEASTLITKDKVNITTIGKPGQYAVYKLMPQTTATYYMYSEGLFDTYGYLYDAEGNLLQKNDDDGKGNNFYIENTLRAGETYYFVSRLYSKNGLGIFLTIFSWEEAWIVESQEKIDQVAVSLPEPKAGEKKALCTDIAVSASVSDNCIVKSVQWGTEDGYDTVGNFEAGHDNILKVILSPIYGYCFTTRTAVTVNGKKPGSRYIDEQGDLTVTYTFKSQEVKVTLPENTKDYTVTTDEKDAFVTKGGSYAFDVKPAAGAALTVKANGTPVKPESGTHYVLTDVQNNVNVTVTAEAPKPEAEKVIVSYYDGSTLYDQVSVKKDSTIYYGTQEKNLPKLTSYANGSNQFFLGWYQKDGTRLTRNTQISEDISVTAKWINGIITKQSSGFTITYKVIEVSDNGKMYLEVTQAKADSSALESNLKSFVHDLLDIESDRAGEVTIENGMEIEGFDADVIAIASNAFANNETLTKIKIPDTVETIGDGAFEGCSALEEVAIPDSVKEIGDSAFKDSAVKTVALPDSIEKIGQGAFAKSNGAEKTEILCSASLSQEMAQDIESAGAKATVLDFALTPDQDIVALTVDETLSVSANAVLGDEDVSEETTWAVAQGDEELLSVSGNTTGKEIAVKAVKRYNNKNTATLIATCRGMQKKLQIRIEKKAAESSDFVVTLDKEQYEYDGNEMTPKVKSITYNGVEIPASEYQIICDDEDNIIYISLDNYEVDLRKRYTVTYPSVKGVKIDKSTLSVTVGEEIALTASIQPAYAKNAGFIWDSDDETIVSQTNQNGGFRAEKAGVATITVKSVTNPDITDTCIVTVNDKKDDPGKGDPGKDNPGKGDEKHTCTFDKGRITKQPTCTKAGEKTYTCTVCHKTKVEAIAMTAHVWTEKTVKASAQKNGYTAKACKNCGKETELKDIYAPAEIELSKDLYSYNGKACKPAVKVKDSAGNEIAAANFDVTYADNKKIGNAKVTVTFKGIRYEGNLTTTFTIASPKTTVSKAKAAKKSITVTWKKQKKNVSGYQIQYSTSKKFDKAVKTKTVKGTKKTSLTISKLKAKKTYYVRIRTYKTVKGTKYYSEWSKTKKVKTK